MKILSSRVTSRAASLAGFLSCLFLATDAWAQLGDGLNTDLALNQPDEFNWRLFATICQKAPDNLQVNVPKQNFKSNSATWETWADDPFTFPGNPGSPQPKPDRANPPDWNKRGRPLQLQPNSQLQLRAQLMHSLVPKVSPFELIQSGGGEVVFRNEASFNFIIKNHLYFTEGLAAAFARGVNGDGYPSGKIIDFPVDAVEVKGFWVPIKDGGVLTKANCHWNYGADGQLYGLVGLHVMSKALPNWTWATFEWSGNPVPELAAKGDTGRSDWHGSKDAFGVKYPPTASGSTTFQPPIFVNGQPSGKPYPAGEITPELAKVFKNLGYDDEWTKEWSNYRLKGSQVDFTDATGQTNFLGNSVIEDGFVQSSSCITCHGAASVNVGGHANGGLGFTQQGQSINGPLPPSLLYDTTTFDPTQQYGVYKVKNYTMDFIWAVAKARPDGKGPLNNP